MTTPARHTRRAVALHACSFITAAATIPVANGPTSPNTPAVMAGLFAATLGLSVGALAQHYRAGLAEDAPAYDRGPGTLADRVADVVVTAAVEVALRSAAVLIAVRAWWRGEPYDFNPLRRVR